MSEEEAIALMQQEEMQNTTVPVIVPSIKNKDQAEQQTSEVKNPLAGLASIDSSFTSQMANQKATPYNRFLEVLNTLDESKRKDNFVTEEEFNRGITDYYKTDDPATVQLIDYITANKKMLICIV